MGDGPFYASFFFYLAVTMVPPPPPVNLSGISAGRGLVLAQNTPKTKFRPHLHSHHPYLSGAQEHARPLLATLVVAVVAPGISPGTLKDEVSASTLDAVVAGVSEMTTLGRSLLVSHDCGRVGRPVASGVEEEDTLAYRGHRTDTALMVCLADAGVAQNGAGDDIPRKSARRESIGLLETRAGYISGAT
jgi:hypothetical protein